MYENVFTRIRNEAQKRNLKESTINAYCNSVGYFLRTINKDVSALTTDDVDAFLTMKRLEGRSPETHNHYRSSIKFLYKRVLKIPWDDEEVPAMKRERNLPTVLTPQEMNAIIDATDNLKHKCKRQVLFPKKWHLFFLKCGKLFSRVCGILFSRIYGCSI